MPTYAIGDIHGCKRTFQALLERLPLQPGDALILLGDLIDRGPDSKGVVDMVFELRENGHEVTCLRGNHEQMLLDAMVDPVQLERWYVNGGWQALASFGVEEPGDIPERYIDFFQTMPFLFETANYLCLHGGPDFSLPDPLGDPGKLLWMRRWYDEINYQWLGQRIILHGHTPVDFELIKTQHADLSTAQYLNLDNGCVYEYLGIDRGDLGRLIAFSLDSGELIWQKCVD